MRTVEIERSDTGEKRTIKVFALKRKQIRALSDRGFTPLGFFPPGDNEREIVQAMVAATEDALETVLSDDDLAFLDECDNLAAKKVWDALYKETYGDKDEEKNSSATTSGTPTAEGSNTA